MSECDQCSVDTDVSPTSITTAHTTFDYAIDSERALHLPVVEYNEEDGEVNSSSVDVYGQRHPIETDKLLRNALRDFDYRLQNNVPDTKKKSVLDAQKKCPDLVNDSFKLMFLRCECFKVDVRCDVTSFSF